MDSGMRRNDGEMRLTHSQSFQQFFVYTTKTTITHNHQPVTGLCLFCDRRYQLIDGIRDYQRHRQTGPDFV